MQSFDSLQNVPEENLTGQVLVKLKPSDAARFKRIAVDRGVKAGNLARAVMLAWMEAVESGAMSAGKISFLPSGPSDRYPEPEPYDLRVAETAASPLKRRKKASGARGGRRG